MMKYINLGILLIIIPGITPLEAYDYHGVMVKNYAAFECRDIAHIPYPFKSSIRQINIMPGKKWQTGGFCYGDIITLYGDCSQLSHELAHHYQWNMRQPINHDAEFDMIYAAIDTIITHRRLVNNSSNRT